MPTLGIIGDEICEDAARHGITFFYMWAGPLQLHYTALPRWGQYLGMTIPMARPSEFRSTIRDRPVPVNSGPCRLLARQVLTCLPKLLRRKIGS